MKKNSRRSTKSTKKNSSISDKNEKYDKIKNQEAESRKVYFVILLAFLMLVGLGVYKDKIVFRHGNGGMVSHSGGMEPPLQRHVEEVKKMVNHAVEVIGDDPGSLESRLEIKVKELDTKVRAIKATGVIMETDPHSLEVTKQLQDATRELLLERYGRHPAYRIRVGLEFQPTIPDFEEKGKDGTIVIEMAPIELIPVSVFTFLEVARTWKGGAFHRNAGHVLQATANAEAITKSLPFQEYSPQFPHAKGTTGYCGRPSGPCWYVSIQDNTRNHGPGSQQQKNPHEADANFGRIVEGMDDVIPRIHSVPQSGFLDQKNNVFIRTMTILVGGPQIFEEWKPR